MLGAEELRIGNWVHLIRAYNEPNGIEIQVNVDSFKITSELRPIPLTEEWLLRFGFDYKEGCYLHNHETAWESLTGSLKEGKLHFYGNSGGIGQPLKYVHQLQNLYFALTNSELIIQK